MQSRFPEIYHGAAELTRVFQAQQRLRLLQPKCIVEYTRVAYTYPIGNVRVTFDRDIRATDRMECFYQSKTDAIPVLPAGFHILEVKYDELLPSYIHQALNPGSLQLQSYSKYFYARNVLREGRPL